MRPARRPGTNKKTDSDLAERVRRILGGKSGLTERKTSILVFVILLLVASLGCAAPTSSKVERRITELERETVDLRERLDALTKAVIVYHGDSWGAHISFPPIDAEVLDVKHGLKLVVLNKGKKDEVKVGYIFDVYLGSTYKGQVQINEVQEGTSSGLILHEVNPISSGDVATTNL